MVIGDPKKGFDNEFAQKRYCIGRAGFFIISGDKGLVTDAFFNSFKCLQRQKLQTFDKS